MTTASHNSQRITFPRIAGLLSATVGLFVLVGWVLDISWIKSLLPGAVEMKANTAVGLLLAGVALCLLDKQTSPRRRWIGQALALLVVLLGLATLGEYVFGWRLGIDELLFRDTTNAYNAIPGRMSPYSAVVFAILGLGLAALPLRSLRWFVWLAANLTILIGGVSFIGYVWNASELVTDRILPPVAINTAIAFVLLGVGLLMASGARTGRNWRKLASLSSVETKTLAGFLAILILLLLIGGHAYRAAVESAESARWVAHTQQVRASLGQVYAAISDAESQQRNYLLSGKPDYLEDYKRHVSAADQRAKALAELIADNPAQLQRLKELQVLIGERVAVLERTKTIFEQSGLAAAQVRIAIGEGRQLMVAIRDAVGRMDSVEAELLKTRSTDSAAKQFGTLLSLLATLAVATAGFMVLYNGIRRELASRTQAEAERDRFFTLALDLLGIANTDGYFKRVNPAFAATLGWSAAEILTRPFIDFVHPDDRAATLAEVEKLSRGETTTHFENRYQCKDGSWKTLAWRAVPQPDGTIYCTGRDMTELKLAEEALRRSEENLSVTLHSIGDAVLATDTQGRVTRLNPIAEKLTGWTQAEAQGRPIAEVFHIINEQTRQPSVIPVDKVLATGEIHGLANHTVIIARDGTERPIADSAAPIRDKAGQVLGVVLVFRDVTQEKAAEKAVRASEALNRAVLNSVMANIAVVDRHGTIIAINEGWERFARENNSAPTSPGVGVGANYLEVCERAARDLGEEAQEILNGIRGVLAHSKVSFKHEYACHAPTEQRWFTMQVSPLSRADGGAVIAQINITERKLAEEKLQASQRRLSLALDAAQIGDWELDMVTQAARRSLRHDQIFGYTKLLPEWTYPMFLQHVHPEDRAGVDQSFQESVAAGREWYFECRILRPDQTMRWIWARGNVFKDGSGKLTQMIGMVGDITDRKRAEEEIRSFNVGLEELVAQRTAEMRQALTTLDATEDAALIFDPETLRHTYVNEGAARQLGYTQKELLGMTALNFIPEFTEARYRELLAPMLRGEVRTHRFITLHRHKDGHDIPVEINLQYVAPAGERPRFIAIARDIAERQKHERLAQRSQRLESIGTLASGVAHDLNNALAPIMMGVEVLKMQYPKESQIVDMFEASAKRAADMVRQLLGFAKGVEGARVSLQPGRLVKELENLMKGSFPKNIQLVIKCDPKLPTVLGDATQLHQILLNLCVNARDAMPHGGTLTVEAQRVEVDATYASSVPDAKPGKYLALRVRDTGTGIPPEILDRIFDPFFTTKAPDKGTGLGLSTVMGIVKGHGGFLQVYSQPGQGSTFTAYLPAEEAGSDTEHVTKATVEFHGQGETILLVDDEPGVRAVARTVLQRLNFKPLTATDGADGLIQAAQHRTELRAIITDLHMPHMDGLTFVRTLRRMLPDIPIVVASGRMEDALAGEFRALGVTNWLDKPFTEAQLAEALKNLLATK